MERSVSLHGRSRLRSAMAATLSVAGVLLLALAGGTAAMAFDAAVFGSHEPPGNDTTAMWGGLAILVGVPAAIGGLVLRALASYVRGRSSPPTAAYSWSRRAS